MINENFGHLVADKVLARVGQVAEKESWVKHLVRCHNDNFALVTELLSEEELKTKLMELFNKIDSLPEDPSYKIYYRCGAVSSEHSIAGKDTVPFFAKLAQVQGIKPNKTEIIIYTESMKDKYFKAKKNCTRDTSCSQRQRAHCLYST
jgi:GGDEF domain-containing protein